MSKQNGYVHDVAERKSLSIVNSNLLNPSLVPKEESEPKMFDSQLSALRRDIHGIRLENSKRKPKISSKSYGKTGTRWYPPHLAQAGGSNLPLINKSSWKAQRQEGYFDQLNLKSIRLSNK